MLGKKNNSFQRMILMSGIAQGSANGPKKIFGRENVNWQGPQKAGKGNENKGDSLSASNDFSHAQEDKHEYRENLHQAFIDDLGGEAVKDSIVANAVFPEMYSPGVVYTKESMDNLKKKYDDYYDDFVNTDEGAEDLENELTSALDDDKSIVSGYDSEKDEFITNQENIDALFHEGAFIDTFKKFQDYVFMRENKKIDKDSSIEDILRYAQENSEQIEKEIEQARLQDAQDRGYDSIEDYEWDLEYAQDSYAEGRGFDVVQREAVSNVVENYIENHGENINEEEKEKVRQHYNRLFNDFYEEGFNSETVLSAALSSNSSFEVVDVRDGDLEVNEEQEEQWAKSFEFDYVKDEFSSYVKDHPYQG